MFSWLFWLVRGKPLIHYAGYHCGCCGKWVEEAFTVPVRESCGKWADTWGLCKDCGVT